MTQGIDTSDPYEAVLTDLRAKRAQIDQTIILLEAMRNGTVAATTGATTAQAAAPETDIHETAGMFLGMSIVDASKKLLAMRKRTMGNVEIAREIQAGGLVLTGADPVNVVGSVLTRRFNQVGDVVKVGRGIWGLKEWYPGRNFKPAKATAAAEGTVAAMVEQHLADEEQVEIDRLLG
jgi:hypothetical protein